MTKKPKREFWTHAATALFVALTVLVGGWYALIWVDPTGPYNPFPAPPPAYPITALPTAPVSPASMGPRQATPTYPATWTPTATGTATPTRSATSTPWPTSTPTPTSTPDPLWRYYIVGMRGQRYKGSQIEIHGLFGQAPKFTTYLVFYTSDNLRISGMMNVPKGQGPFPVIILCHGYIHPDQYATGNDTWREADYLAEHGYLTISPDYRGHAASDNGVSFFHIGYANDVLNLIASLGTVEKADPRRVGLWGHSMGGGVALKAGVVSKQVDAVALFGSVSGDERENLAYGLGNGPGGYGVAWFGTPQTNRLAYKRISAINYLQYSPPLSIHHGTADSIVPYEWSEELYRAAQEKGLASELYLYPDAEHTFILDDWDLAMERTLQFYDTYVQAD